MDLCCVFVCACVHVVCTMCLCVGVCLLVCVCVWCSDSPPLCQSCRAASSVKVALDPARSRGDRKRIVTFGGVTKMESVSWEEERQEEEGGKDESQTLQHLLSSATVAMPTAGMSSGQERE